MISFFSVGPSFCPKYFMMEFRRNDKNFRLNEPKLYFLSGFLGFPSNLTKDCLNWRLLLRKWRNVDHPPRSLDAQTGRQNKVRCITCTFGLNNTLAFSAAVGEIKLSGGEGQRQIKIKYMDFPAKHKDVCPTAYSHAPLTKKLKIILPYAKSAYFPVILFELYS